MNVPAGWKPVPEIPTREMSAVYKSFVRDGKGYADLTIWKAMLDAAPEPVQGEGLTLPADVDPIVCYVMEALRTGETIAVPKAHADKLYATLAALRERGVEGVGFGWIAVEDRMPSEADYPVLAVNLAGHVAAVGRMEFFDAESRYCGWEVTPETSQLLISCIYSWKPVGATPPLPEYVKRESAQDGCQK